MRALLEERPDLIAVDRHAQRLDLTGPAGLQDARAHGGDQLRQRGGFCDGRGIGGIGRHPDLLA